MDVVEDMHTLRRESRQQRAGWIQVGLGRECKRYAGHGEPGADRQIGEPLLEEQTVFILRYSPFLERRGSVGARGRISSRRLVALIWLSCRLLDASSSRWRLRCLPPKVS